MAFVLQSDDGDVDGANAYITLDEFKAYHDARANDYSAATDDQLSACIVKATDYLDMRFQFVGYRRHVAQTTCWPRWDAVDVNDRYLRGIPQGVKEATAEYALRALKIVLLPDPKLDPSGQHVRSKSTKVGQLETHVTYDGQYELPKYPAADRKLTVQGLIIRGMTISRA